MRSFVIKGNICYSEPEGALVCRENSYLVVSYGVSAGVFSEIPEQYKSLELLDYSNKLIIPGLCDLHIHAPQFPVRALGMDMELLAWLENHAFPQEAMYADLDYANRSYGIFAQAMKKSFTSRACVFGTVHPEASALLAQKLDEAGLVGFVGMVNMDRDCPESLREPSDTEGVERFLALSEGLDKIFPIITPRFVPSCTDKLMQKLGELALREGLPVQSHLSESLSEIALVAELCPDCESYGAAYDRFSLFGQTPTVMAHCVHSSAAERELMRKRGVFIAHCPQSNTNIASGIAPIRAYMNEGQKIGLGTDVAGGSSESMARAVTDAVMVSKLRYCCVDNSLAPLSFAEAFFLATVGGGEFFGKVGSFCKGYEADVLVLDDSQFESAIELSAQERLERLFYIGSSACISAKFVQGEQLF